MLRLFMTAAASVALVGAAVGIADAHPALRSANPPLGGALVKAPSEIRLTFSEALIARFSGLEVTDQRGRVVIKSNAQLNIPNKRQLVVPLRAHLAAGTYRVKWHAVSADTHRVNGTYTFRIRT